MPKRHRKGEQSSVERQQVIEAAVADVKGGKTIRKAAKLFGIPKSTLATHCSKFHE